MIKVKHDPKIRIPKIGDKVIITNFDLLPKMVVREITKKGDIVEVTDVTPIPIGSDGNYHWEYAIDAVEFNGFLLGLNSYKFI